MPNDWEHQSALEMVRLESRIEASEKEIEYLKRALEKRDDRLDELQNELTSIKTERENNVKASRNVIIGALVSLAVGVVGFLIQRGL